MRAIDRMESWDGAQTFWTLGNEPTQNLGGWNISGVALCLKAQTLLSDVIVASASYVFESPMTRTVLRVPNT